MGSRFQVSRRGVVVAGCAGLVGLADGARAQTGPRREPLDIGGVSNGSLKFDPIAAQTEAAQKPKPAPEPPERRIGFAIAGLGRLSGEEVLPAFAECRRARITALVSG